MLQRRDREGLLGQLTQLRFLQRFLQGTNHLFPPECLSSDLGFVCDLFEGSHGQNLLGIPLPLCPGELEGRAVKPG